MSRKYCSVCGESHDNRREGLCDKHLEAQEADRIASHNEEVEMFENFMGRSEEERWKILFDFMHSLGWSL